MVLAEAIEDVRVEHAPGSEIASIRLPEGISVPEDYAIKEGDVVVGLKFFEGPLELLLYLIRKHKMDIFDIPISEITSRYLAYINMLETMDIDIAGEFIAMSATLILIKSKMLLPRRNEEEDESEYGEDPRRELIIQLLEYQKYRDAAQRLEEKPILGRDVFLRPRTGELKEHSQEVLIDVSPNELADALRRVLDRVASSKARTINLDEVPVERMIERLVNILRVEPSVSFMDLFATSRIRAEVVAMFLAVLELAKLGAIRIFQFRHGGDIFIEARLENLDSKSIIGIGS